MPGRKQSHCPIVKLFELAEGEAFKDGHIFAQPQLHKTRSGWSAENTPMIAGVIAVGVGDEGKLAHVARVEPELGRREPDPTLIIDNHHGRT